MKKYQIQIVSNSHWDTHCDFLRFMLNDDWKIERADATKEMIVYILSKEEQYD